MALITNVAQAQTAGAYDASHGLGSYKALPTSPTNIPPSTAVSTAIPSPYTAPTVASTNTTSPIKTQVPVVTAAAAQADFNQKQQTYNNLKNQISEQRSVLAQQAAQKAADDAQKAMLDAKNKLDQQQLSIQQQQADTAKTTADAKAAAAAGLTGGQTQRNPPPGWDAQTYANFKAANPNLEPDAQDTAMMQAAGNQGTGSTTGSTTDTGTGILSQEATALSGIQDQRTQAFQDMKSQVAQIMNGTFPLSATEQSLITATQASFDNQIQAQEQANKADVGVQQEASFRQGGEYTPQIAAGQLAATIAYGVQKITNLDQQAALTVANLQQGFETKDYTMVNDLYDKLDKQLSDKSSSIKDLFSAAIANEKDLRDYNQRVSQFNQDQALKQQQFAEQQKKDAADIQHQKTSDAIASADLKLKQATFNATYGIFSSANGQSVSANNIPGVVRGANGATYMDLSQFTDPQQTTAAANIARRTGVPIVTAAQAPAVRSWQNVNSLLNTIQTEYNQLNSSSNVLKPGPLTSAGNPTFTSFQQNVGNLNKALTDLGAKDPSFVTVTNTTIPDLSLWGNITGANNNLQTKINTLRDGLNSSMQSMIPNMPTPIFGQSFTSLQDANNYASQSGYGTAITNLISKYPNASADEILNMINTGQEAKQ